MDDIGNIIRQVRESRGMTQNELADKMNVSSKAVSAWESGARNPKDIIGLANALNVGIETFTGDAPARSHNTFSMHGSEGGRREPASLRIRSFNGFMSLNVNGEDGEFMEMYNRLDREDKLYVITQMLKDLGYDNINLKKL